VALYLGTFAAKLQYQVFSTLSKHVAKKSQKFFLDQTIAMV
jgi:hypothetical protein